MRAGVLLGALALLAACGEAPPQPAGLEPAGLQPERSAPAPKAEPRVVLSEPEREAAPAAATEPAPAEPAAPETHVVDLGEYGTFEIVSWEGATRRAERELQQANADAELNRFRAELVTRRP